MKKGRCVVLSIVSVGLICLALGSCSGGKDKTGSSEGKPQEITFWVANIGGESTIELLDNFNKRQNEIKVNYEFQGNYNDIITKLKAAIQSKADLPDLCIIYGIGTRFMADSGVAIPIQEYIDSTGFDFKGNVSPLAAAFYAVNGIQYAMPFAVSTPILYYNKDVFKAAGLDPEKPPRTYAQIAEYAKKIQDSGASRYGYSQSIYSYLFEQQMYTLGEYFLNNENGRAAPATRTDFDRNGGGVKLFTMWNDFYKQPWFVNYGATTTDTPSAFYAGQIGMMIESTALVGAAERSSAFQVGTGPYPVLEENDRGGVCVSGCSVWMLQNNDKARADAAWKFLEYTTEPEVQAKFSRGTGYTAFNPKSYELPEMVQFLQDNPNYKTAVDALNNTRVNNYTAGVSSAVQPEARSAFNKVIERMYDGELTPTQAVDQLAATINQALDDYNASIKK
ncbi:ABC transporter substrate-binding protein [Breznakiella homolactica]|uniref:sn-glycerol-3-phosphate-binding periplasmic protein UgpB n=1 Tax=Breznakiella homolactica TaxID=2798577 RepID=A0A7T7XMI6_9SPIR|nr:ABC transporter substrate-binding protein [Breznakiella homolactica]QQO08962.1 ABC transporter substrate-binding protein [Breznakiella homolactica]